MRVLISFAVYIMLNTFDNLEVLAEEINCDQVDEAFRIHNIVPDCISYAPTSYVTVIYSNDVEVQLGNELTPSQVLTAPTVLWEADPSKFYLLLMVDPDAPSRQNPALANVAHWIVANIPGNNLDVGETQAFYLPPTPPPLTGLHRYVFLVYEQPRKLEFHETLLTNLTTQGRVLFSITKFAEKYDLGSPIAGNFFQSQFSGTNGINLL